MQELIKVTNELIPVEECEKFVVQLFEQDAVSKVVDDLVEFVRPIQHDISTEKGRKELKQFVARIKKSSNILDGLGKDHVAKLKALPKIVDASRKSMRDRLEALAEEKLRPLTEYEAAEEKRQNDIKARINEIDPFMGGIITIQPGERTTEALKALAEKAAFFEVDDTFQEYQELARKTKDDVILKLSGLIAIQMKQEAEAAALEKLRLEAEEKARLAREEQIRKEAADKARRDAEEKAAAERQAMELKAEAERQESIRREREAREAQERAEREKIATEERAKLEQERAVKEERERLARIEQERIAKEEAERLAAEKKSANIKHRAKINNLIVLAVMGFGMTQENGKKFVEAVVKGEIPNLTINY